VELTLEVLPSMECKSKIKIEEESRDEERN